MSPAPASNADFVSVLSPAWAAIQERHPDLPTPAFGQYHGYDDDIDGQICFPGDEGEGPDGQDITYSVVTVEIADLCCSAEMIFETLLHEAAHFLDWVRHPAADPGPGGHGAAFAEIAAELGLEITWSDCGSYVYGTDLTSDGSGSYAAAIAALAGRLAPIHAEDGLLFPGDAVLLSGAELARVLDLADAEAAS